MKIYNNVHNRKDSPFVPVFNPCDSHGKPHASDVWNANGWSGHNRVILDWEGDNDVLINVDPTAGAHAFVRDRWFHIVEAARANGVETLGAYGIPWCRFTDMARRVARNTWAHISVLNWVCPSIYWYEEELPEYERKILASTTAMQIAMFVTGQKTVIPMVSIESMKKGGGARILTDEEIRHQCRAVISMENHGLRVGGIMIWSMLARWTWLQNLRNSDPSIGSDHPVWDEFCEAEMKLKARKIDLLKPQISLSTFLGREVARFRRIYFLEKTKS